MSTKALVFEWDEQKNAHNQRKHHISFSDAKTVFHKPYHTVKSTYPDEERFVAIGLLKGRIVAIVFTYRNDRIRLISARRARRNEETIYQEIFG